MRCILTVAASTVAMICLLATASAHAEEAPPPPGEPQDEVTASCRQWLEWLVDGKVMALMGARISLNGPALQAISETCLNRDPDWTAAQPPIPDWTPPGKRDVDPEPGPQPDPAPTSGRVNI